MKNMGFFDRMARLLFSILLVALALVFENILARVVLGLGALFVLYESLSGWCALYALIGKNTCPVSFGKSAGKKGKKKIIIIGAGPGGLSAGMILAHRGHDVHIFERRDEVGGRNSPIRAQGYAFDLGPTFVMLPQLFEDVFALAGRDYKKELDIMKLDTLYRLRYGDGRDFFVSYDKEKLKQEFDRVFPGQWTGYERWFAFHKKKTEKVIDCLRVPYQTPFSYFNRRILKALRYIQAHRSVMSVLGDYFTGDDLKWSMAFQAKYLGMSPWDCPGTFTILPFMEHAYGLSHYRGGVHQLTQAMARIFKEEGGTIYLSQEVKKINTAQRVATGVTLSSGETVGADAIIMNSDFAYGLENLLDESARPSFTNKKLARKDYSCSTFMIYLGVNKKYDIPHHNIFFGGDYRQNLDEISKLKVLPQDPAFYIQNACVTDETLAPEGKSAIYILVPVPNLTASIDWSKEKKSYRDLVMRKVAARTELKDIEDHIEVEKIITPLDWQDDLKIYLGATFNLAHTVKQMLYLRPHNRYDDVRNMYLVGGGTHPGSGLPTILESGRIAADLIEKD